MKLSVLAFSLIISSAIIMQSCGGKKKSKPDCNPVYSTSDIIGIFKGINFPINKGDVICKSTPSVLTIDHVNMGKEDELKKLMDTYDKVMKDAGFLIPASDRIDGDSNSVFCRDSAKTGRLIRFFIRDTVMIKASFRYRGYFDRVMVELVDASNMIDVADKDLKEKLAIVKKGINHTFDLINNHVKGSSALVSPDSIDIVFYSYYILDDYSKINLELPFTRDYKASDTLHILKSLANAYVNNIMKYKFGAFAISEGGNIPTVKNETTFDNWATYEGTFKNGTDYGRVYIFDTQSWEIICSAAYSAKGTLETANSERDLWDNLYANTEEQQKKAILRMNSKIRLID